MLTILALYESYSGDRCSRTLGRRRRSPSICRRAAERLASVPVHRSAVRHPPGRRGRRLQGAVRSPDARVSLVQQRRRGVPRLCRARARGCAAHGAVLLKTALLLYRDLHASLNRRWEHDGIVGPCYPHSANSASTKAATSDRTVRCSSLQRSRRSRRTRCTCRASPAARAGASSPWARCPAAPPAPRSSSCTSRRASCRTAGARHGRAAPALSFTQSAHSATRGTWTTPESQHIDRDAGGWPYASPGAANVPMALKWMLASRSPRRARCGLRRRHREAGSPPARRRSSPPTSRRAMGG